MKHYLPLFPLNIIVFPGEELNLHIFEPRYKELINDCRETNTTFGIPCYLQKRVEYGTEVKLASIEKEYPDGRMDIRTLGLQVFKVNKFDNPRPGKLYAGGEVTILPKNTEAQETTTSEMIALTKELYQSLEVVQEIMISNDVTSFDLGHKVGLSQEQEYTLLQIEQEETRQRFIITHLQKAIPLLQDIEKTKERIRMNGHFRHFDPLDF